MQSPQNNTNIAHTKQLVSDESHQSNDDNNAVDDNDDANSESVLGENNNRVAIQPCINGTIMAAPLINGAAPASDRPPMNAARPTTIFTKATGLNSADKADGFARKAIPLNRLESRNLNGINVKFEQIVHKTQGRLCWNRGEWNIEIYLHWHLNTNSKQMCVQLGLCVPLRWRQIYCVSNQYACLSFM